MAITANNVQPAKEKGTFWPAFWAQVWVIIQAIGHSLFTWSWCKSLLYWLIISGGTMAELAFLIGSVWMSLNATVHPFILMFLSEEQTRYLTFLATSAYVALPELIVSLAVIVTIGHIRVFFYNRKNWPALIWTALYGIPALFFACISAYTIGESVANVNFTMPEPFIIARALAGYLFAFTSLLYWQLGKPQEVDRLKKKDEERESLRVEKDGKISDLQKETSRLNALLESETTRLNTLLQSETTRLNNLIEAQKGELQKTKRQQEDLINALNKSDEDALHGYSQEFISWLKSGIKTASLDDITRFSGHTKRKIQNAIDAGKLQTATRNKELILVGSLIEWLKQNQPSASRVEAETGPILRVVNQ